MSIPLVSVVIPCYQQARLLPEAIESALNQTHPRVEVVVVNDGSTDQTEAVVRRYGDRVLYLPQINRGTAAARNAGCRAASGDYVQFLDADDTIRPRKLARQVEVLEGSPHLGVCYAGYEKIDLSTGTRLPAPRVCLEADALHDILCNWETALSIPIHVALFRRSVWDGGAPFDETLRAREDWVMWVGLIARGIRMAYLDETLAEYRIHAEGKCRGHLQMHVGTLEAVALIRQLIPPGRQREFEEHAWDLSVQRLRGSVFDDLPDYRSLYREALRDLQAVTTSRRWHVAGLISRIAGIRRRRPKQERGS